MKPRALILVDGEHYPPVVRDAIARVSETHDVVAAALLGGGEKLDGPLDLGPVPVVAGRDAADALVRALEAHRVDVVVDCSDAPVVTTSSRFRLAALALARGCTYAGADFRFDPPPRPVLTDRPTVAVIGTGKRTGKTAVSAAFARRAVARGLTPVIVAMGRGGPARPVVTYGARARPTVADLLALADAGEHAASDTYEDAVMAGVTTVGARRAGAGLAGATLHDTVAEAVAVADAEQPDLLILEGSGTAIPPARADATILVVGGATPPEELTAGLGTFRLLISDLAVVTMADEPVFPSGTLAALISQVSALDRALPIVKTVFRPAPVGSVRGKKVFFATTAPEAAGPAMTRHLEEQLGAVVVGATHRLSDRTGLVRELARAEGTYEILLTEVKAAAIDVAARAAIGAGAEVVFCDNEPVPVDGDLAGAFDAILDGVTR